jgi:hypothetical protein
VQPPEEEPAPPRAARGKAAAATKEKEKEEKEKESAEESKGWHSFKKGDKVEYTFQLEDGESAQAIVFGVTYHKQVTLT